MRRLAVVAALLGALGLWVARALEPPPPAQAIADAFELSGVTVVNPGRGHEEGRTVIVRDGAIRAIRQASAADLPPRFPGAFVLPGLIDLHTHLPADNPLKLTAHFALLHLAFGVTTIREVGDADGTAVAAAREGISGGLFPGPRLFACGPFVSGPAPARWINTRIVATAADAARVVRSIREEGFDCVKAYDDLSRESLRAVVAAARHEGLPVLGHVPTAIAYSEGLLPHPQHFFGVPDPASLERDHIIDRVSDWQDVDDAYLERIVAATLEHDLSNTPTLVANRRLLLFEDPAAARADAAVRLLPRFYRDVVWDPQDGVPVYRNLSAERLAKIRDALAKKLELVRMLHDAGARLYLGTDAQQPFVVPGAGLQQEMKLFVEAGVPPEDVWQMGTSAAAAELGVPLLGTVVPGAPADLLVFREDPTRDLAALDSLVAVVAGGKLYRKSDLDAALARNREHFEGLLWDRLSVVASRMILARTVRRDY
jgi:imidazolonepropionase-like amidohydrolase